MNMTTMTSITQRLANMSIVSDGNLCGVENWEGPQSGGPGGGLGGVRTPFLGPKWGVRGGPRGGPEVNALRNLLQKSRVWALPPKMAPGPPRTRFLPGPPRPRLSSLNPVTKAP